MDGAITSAVVGHIDDPVGLSFVDRCLYRKNISYLLIVSDEETEPIEDIQDKITKTIINQHKKFFQWKKRICGVNIPLSVLDWLYGFKKDEIIISCNRTTTSGVRTALERANDIVVFKLKSPKADACITTRYHFIFDKDTEFSYCYIPSARYLYFMSP
jgi:hypothetical protein